MEDITKNKEKQKNNSIQTSWQYKTLDSYKNQGFYILCMVEAVGHAILQFPKGTDYILKLIRLTPLAYYGSIYYFLPSILVLHILWTQQPISRYRAVGFLHIPLGISILKLSPIKPSFHLQITLQGDPYESNPRPKTLPQELLRVQSVIFSFPLLISY